MKAGLAVLGTLVAVVAAVVAYRYVKRARTRRYAKLVEMHAAEVDAATPQGRKAWVRVHRR